VNPALLFLIVRSVRGRIVRSLRMLRQPKYLVGILAFAAWIGFWMSNAIVDLFNVEEGERTVEVQFGGMERLHEVAAGALPGVHLLAAFLFAVIFTVWWLVPWGRVALSLRQSEIHLLAPAPVKRRDLIQYAILRSQPGILFGCMILTVFMGSGSGAARLLWFLAMWVMLTLWDLHSKGRSLWIARQKEIPAGAALRRRIWLYGFLLVYWSVLAYGLSVLAAGLMTLSWPEWGDPESFNDMVSFLKEAASTYGPRARNGILGWALSPFLWLTAPFFSRPTLTLAGLAGFLRLLLLPLLLLVVHNEWVVRSQVRFEEAALAHDRRRVEKEDARSRFWKTPLRRRKQAPFRLAPQGPPEMAIYWKNLLMARRTSLRATVLLGLAVALLVGALPALLGAPRFFFIVIMMSGIGLPLFMPLLAGQHYRNDLRTDLLSAELLRPLPIPGWKLIAAEVAGPATTSILGAAFGVALLVALDLGAALARAGITFRPVDGSYLTPSYVMEQAGLAQPFWLPLFLLGAVQVVAAAAVLSSTLQNLTVLLFPGWVHLGMEKMKGAASFGQNLVVFSILSLGMLVCTLPGALMVGLTLLAQWFWGIPVVAWELPLLGSLGAAPMLVVAAFLMRAGGGLWDRLDPSREILSGAS
jgi:hypothetical protein